MSKRRRPSDGSLEASQLTELLVCERELADLLTATRAEAERRVAEAREEAAGAEAELEASLADETRLARAQIRADTQGRLREIAQRARTRTELFDGLSEAEVDHLAGMMFRSLIGAEEPP